MERLTPTSWVWWSGDRDTRSQQGVMVRAEAGVVPSVALTKGL